MARIDFRTLMRAAAVSLITDYRATLADGRLANMNVYRGRPRSINAPQAFVDSIGDVTTYTGLNQRTVRAEVVVLFGTFDGGDTVDQADAFVDGLWDWTLDNMDAAHANTTVAVVETTDEPTFVPDWMPPDQQKTYFGVRITLEGLALQG